MDLQHALDKAVLGLFGPKSFCSTFLVTIYCSLKFAWREDIPTACTNGRYLYINPDWFLTLSEDMRVTLISHELWHIAYMHMVRCGERDHRIFNAAADYAINLMLHDHGYTFDRNPDGSIIGLLDEQYRDMSAEQIYEKLLENTQQIKLPFGEDISHEGGEDGGEPLTESEKGEIVAVLTRAALASQMNPSEAGHIPGEITSMMDQLLRPKIKWYTHLDRWLTEHCDDGFTWTKPNRRFREVYLPSKAPMENGLARLLYAIDCSGSLTDKQLLRINSELRGLQDKFMPESMKIVSFDTVIHDVWEFDRENDLTSLEIHGRGGTEMDEVFALAAQEKPHALIMFSDMDCQIPPPIRGVEVLWVCLDRPHWIPPYGKVIHVDSRQDF